MRFFAGDKVRLRFGAENGEFVCYIEGESLLSEKQAEDLCKFSESDIPYFDHPDVFFHVLVCKALSAHYGWRFDVFPLGIGFSHLRVSLTLPLSDDLPLLVLHAPYSNDGLDEIIKTEFADIDL